MTIGIAVHGKGAGLAAFRALRAVEQVARGAIGGFASFVALTDEGLVRAETQRGGSTTLFTAGERTGVEPPAPIAEARAAALMSSGPDRPTPLGQFTAGAEGIGLVTGHRVPNRPGVDGRSLLEGTLRALAGGADAEAAVRDQLDRNPEADAGLIAIDRSGVVFAADSARVQRRTDRGRAHRTDPATGATVAVLHNSIHPVDGIAELAAAVALDTMNPADRRDFGVLLQAGVPLSLGSAQALLVDDGHCVRGIVVVDSALLQGRHEGGITGFRAEIRRGETPLGHAVDEPFGVVQDGRLVSISGAPRTTIGVRQLPVPA
ncbi:MAG: DUF6963 family protein [Pseudomonadota bacterium]